MRRAVGTVVTMFVLILGGLPAIAQVDVPPRLETRRVIVELDPTGPVPERVADGLITRFGGVRGAVFEHALSGFVADLPQPAIDALWQNPNVLRITEDRVVASIASQVESSGYDRSDVDLAPPPVTTTTDCPTGEVCTDVDIAILDTGSNDIGDLNVVARTDCSNIILPGFGSCQNGQGIDGHGHGTFVAGVAAAFDNGGGVVGVAPGARIHSVKVLSDAGTGYLSAIIAGVDWVTARAGVIDVVNMSLAGEFTDASLNTAIANSVAAGVTYVVAAGNDDADAATYSPANHPDVITVSAVADADGGAGGLSGFTCRDGELDDTLASFSNYGTAVDIAAPGVCIVSVWNDGGTAVGSGTSAAAPFVAGAAARYIAAQPSPPVPGAVATALLTDAHAQGSPCGFTGDKDASPEPMLFVNGPAFGGDGECGVVAPDPTAPTAPGSLVATPLGFPVSLSWTAASDPESGILEYRVYRDSVPASGEVMIATPGPSATSYVDEDTAPGTTYTYTVSAVNLQFGEGPRSAAAEASTAADDPTDAGWWALDDGTGTIADDSTAWSRDGTLVNGPVWVAGKVGGALDLDGANDRVELDPAVLDGFGDVTFATWINTTKTGQQALISGANGSNANEFLFELTNATTLRFYTGWSSSAGVEWSIDSIADGQWHHLALVRNDTLDRVTAYLDGVSLGTWGLTQPMELLDVQALVLGQDQDSVGGGYQSAQAVDGALDEVRIYTRLLTQDEIDVLSLRDLTPPTAPATLTAQAAGYAVDLTWSPASDAESGISSYEIWRGSGIGVDDPKELWATVPGTSDGYRDTAVQAATPYAYEVRAVNGGGIGGDPSPPATVTAGAADPNLLGWWALDDGSGAIALDWAPPARPGALAGDPVWTSGATGGALSFDGSGDRVDLEAAVLDGVDDMSVSLWFSTTKNGVQAILSGANAGNDAEIELIPISSTVIRFYTGEANTSFASWTVPSISTGVWHHVVVTRDSSIDEVTLYVDGVSYGAKSEPMNPLSISAGGLLLGQEQDSVGGGFDSSQAFVGAMDEVRLYDRVLTASEVADLAGLGVPDGDVTPPAAPTGVVAVAGDGEVSLDWDDNGEGDLASYAVYRSEVAGGPYAVVASGLGVSAFVDGAVVNGTTYYYVVSAFDGSGNESPQSGEASATPAAPPTETYVDLVVADGAFAYWRLGETSGTTAVDAIGGHDATYRNGVVLGAVGLVGGDAAATFDGSDDYIAVSDSRDINTGGPYAARTVELWFRADDVAGRQILFEEGGTTRGMSMYLDGGLVYFSVWNRRNDDGAGSWGPVWVAAPIAAGSTYHAVLVFDASGDRLEGYLNGSSVGSQTGVRNLYRHSANIGIGGLSQQTFFHDGQDRSGTGYQFGGILDEVALYAVPLAGAQVTAHWEAGSAG